MFSLPASFALVILLAITFIMSKSLSSSMSIIGSSRYQFAGSRKQQHDCNPFINHKRNGGIPTVRVDTMCEAVEKLNGGMYLFTAINGDSIDYLPMLKVLSEVSPTPVFIIKNQITLYEQIKALHNGADACTVFQSHVEDNIMLFLLASYQNQALSQLA